MFIPASPHPLSPATLFFIRCSMFDGIFSTSLGKCFVLISTLEVIKAVTPGTKAQRHKVKESILVPNAPTY